LTEKTALIIVSELLTEDHLISDLVLKLLELASVEAGSVFYEDEVDGGTEEVPVNRVEDMLVAVCSIA